MNVVLSLTLWCLFAWFLYLTFASISKIESKLRGENAPAWKIVIVMWVHALPWAILFAVWDAITIS